MRFGGMHLSPKDMETTIVRSIRNEKERSGRALRAVKMGPRALAEWMEWVFVARDQHKRWRIGETRAAASDMAIDLGRANVVVEVSNDVLEDEVALEYIDRSAS